MRFLGVGRLIAAVALPWRYRFRQGRVRVNWQATGYEPTLTRVVLRASCKE